MFLSVADASDELGLSRRHMERLIAGGTIPSLRLGRRRLIPREALYRFLASLLNAMAPRAVRAPGRPRRT